MMNATQLSLILCVAVLAVSANAGPADPPAADDPLVVKYDLNHNGNIDAEEHREYVRALSRQRQQEARTRAEQRPQLSPDERRFYHPPRFTPELLPQYDTNNNGKLDPDELKAARQAEQQERERRLQKSKETPLQSR
jgi:hypothetical protein